MSDEGERLQITEKTAQLYNLPYYEDVAERAGMLDSEIKLELKNLRKPLPKDDLEAGKLFLEIVLESYRKELLVHMAMLLLDKRLGAMSPPTLPAKEMDKTISAECEVVPPKLSWRDIFDTDKGIYGLDTANKAAKDAGYNKFSWSGCVLTVDENINLGSLEELGLI